jgi:hypothetical protein
VVVEDLLPRVAPGTRRWSFLQGNVKEQSN